MKKHFVRITTFLFVILFVSCNTIKTAIYDQYSYQQDIALKVETLAVLKHGTESYDAFETQIEHLLLEMEKMEEYEKNKPNNSISYKMWELMTDENRNSVAGLFKMWKTKGQLSSVFLLEANDQIEAAFDALIKYEISKNKENENILLNVLN